MLWYPLKNKEATDLFYKKMKRTGIKKQLICELNLYPNDVAVGLNGTGLFVINPPWQFDVFATQILQYLANVLNLKMHLLCHLMIWQWLNGLWVSD